MSSPEFQLAVDCCRRAFAADPVCDVPGSIDWARFIRLVRYHRVQALAWTGLVSARVAVPPPVADTLRSDAQDIAALNLRIAVELGELRAQFEAAGVALMFVKGLTVGKLAYGNPMLKTGWDIDILVDRLQLGEAAGLLLGRGYRQMVPRPDASVERWHRKRKESVWSRGDGLHVELHTRLADNEALIGRIGIHSPRREVEIVPGITVPTLERDELFAYLCVHGASSLWFRLKWITDLAAILHRLPPPEIERLYVRSQELGAGRASAFALLLADRLYGTLGGSPLRAELARAWVNRWLLQEAWRQLAGRIEPVEPTSVTGGTIPIHYVQFLLLPGLRYKLSELYRQARVLFP